MTALALLDELQADAWPPATVEHHGSWRFRRTGGLTRRANSVLALGCGDEVPRLLDAAEAFYARHGASTVVQVSAASAAPTLVPHLVAHGYRPTARTLVVRAPTTDVVDRTRPIDRAGGMEVDLTEAPTDDWFALYWSVEHGSDRDPTDRRLCRQVLLAPSLPTVFAAVRRGPEVVGTGQIVLDRGWAGVQCVTTVPAHRRRGVAGAVLHALASEAAARGASRTYLAVTADNLGARRLYGRAGFRPAHEYHYYVTGP